LLRRVWAEASRLRLSLLTWVGWLIATCSRTWRIGVGRLLTIARVGRRSSLWRRTGIKRSLLAEDGGHRLNKRKKAVSSRIPCLHVRQKYNTRSIDLRMIGSDRHTRGRCDIYHGWSVRILYRNPHSDWNVVSSTSDVDRDSTHQIKQRLWTSWSRSNIWMKVAVAVQKSNCIITKTSLVRIATQLVKHCIYSC